MITARGVIEKVTGVLAAAATSILLAGCAVSGPPTLGETAGVKPAAAPTTPVASSPLPEPNTGAGQAATPAAAGRSQQVKVVMLLPLTGAPQVAAVAKGLKQAGELALFDLDNPTVQLVVKDDKGTQEGARAAAEEAVKEGAELILGPLFSKSVASAIPVARAADIPVIAFSNDAQVAGQGAYLLSFLAAPEVDRIVGYASAQSRRRFAALVSGDAHGRIVEQALRAAVARHGGAVVAREEIPVDVNSMVEPAQRLAAAIAKAEGEGAPVDALLVPGGQDMLTALGPLLATTGIDLSRIKLIGTGGWDLPGGGRMDALAGSWFAGPDPRGWREFAERFAKTYGAPPHRLATLAYDAMGVAVALSGNPAGARYTQANLTRASGFAGVDGSFRLLPSGLSERALAVLEVQKFGVNVIDPAPSAFTNAQLGAPASSAN